MRYVVDNFRRKGTVCPMVNHNVCKMQMNTLKVVIV